MGILNYSTSIAAMKTATQTQDVLAKHGASHVSIGYHDGHPVELAFAIDTEFGERAFRLPVNVDGVYAAMRTQIAKRQIERRYGSREQAERTAWRILKDWVEAQVAIIEAGLSRIDDVMLPYMVTGSGQTIAVQWRESATARAAIEGAA